MSCRSPTSRMAIANTFPRGPVATVGDRAPEHLAVVLAQRGCTAVGQAFVSALYAD